MPTRLEIEDYSPGGERRYKKQYIFGDADLGEDNQAGLGYLDDSGAIVIRQS